jgi:hypothetical protein
MVVYWSCSQPLENLFDSPPAGMDRIVLCPPYPETAERFRAYLRDGAVPVGGAFAITHSRANGRCEASIYPVGRPKVRVTSAASWFGRLPLPAGEVEATLKRLAREINAAFRRDRPLPLVSPAVCGMALWREEAGDRYPELPEELQTLIRSTSGQGREERLVLPEVAEFTELQAWDIRLAYPSCMEHLPIGPAVHDEERELPMVGRVQVRFRVPAEWAHVGLLPTKRWGSGLEWPSEPGREAEGWCDAREARLAINYGWEVRVLERLVLQEGEPLDQWRRRLLRLFGGAEERGERALRLAYRAVLNQTCADFWGRGRQVTQLVRPVGAAEAVERPVPEQRRQERDSHPEWPAAVWARCRHKLTRYLLQVPRADLLGCYVDELYTTATPSFPPRGEIGHIRCKGAMFGRFSSPQSWGELWQLKRALADTSREPEDETEADDA